MLPQAREEELISEFYTVNLDRAAAPTPLHLLLHPQPHPAVRPPRLDVGAQLRRIRIQGSGGRLVSLSQRESTLLGHRSGGGSPVHVRARAKRECRLCCAQNHVSEQCPVLAVGWNAGEGPLPQPIVGGQKGGSFEACPWISRVPDRTLGIMEAIKNLASLHCAQGTAGASFRNKVHTCTCMFPVLILVPT